MDGGFPVNGVAMELANTSLNATDNDSASNWCDALLSYGDGDLGLPGEANSTVTTTLTAMDSRKMWTAMTAIQTSTPVPLKCAMTSDITAPSMTT